MIPVPEGAVTLFGVEVWSRAVPGISGEAYLLAPLHLLTNTDETLREVREEEPLATAPALDHDVVPVHVIPCGDDHASTSRGLDRSSLGYAKVGTSVVPGCVVSLATKRVGHGESGFNRPHQ